MNVSDFNSKNRAEMVDRIMTRKLSEEDLIENYFTQLEREEILDESKEYTKYVKGHIRNVKNGYRWMKKNLPELFPKGFFNDENKKIRGAIRNHDKSKWKKEEYKAYDAWNNNKGSREEFDNAWNHHQKSNKHHWQYWLLTKKDGSTVALDMPYENIIEMVCDWWTFSWKENDLYSIFDWYNRNKNQMILSTKTRSTLENILHKMKNKIDELQNEEKKELKESLFLTESSWNIENFDTEEKIEEELKRLQNEKEKHLKDDDMPSFYFENIDKHIEELNKKMENFESKHEEKIQESRLPSDPSVDPQFGVPSQKKYPLFDEQHVRSAIKLFGHVDPAYERELARAIIAKMKKYNIPYNSVGPDNRLYKYIPEKFRKEE